MVGEINERGGDGEDKIDTFLKLEIYVPSFKGHNFLFLVLFTSMKRLQTFPLHIGVDN
jgi:hypothetical protein